ncbi:HD-GYP domain-containing protein [Cohnella thermotolerans]|jgi:HD-GYP domain-containing protein (c-di-GMP phosphodiesterase class II)|uniref:HD-GYP domain-containing protein n=1 Tax=Cohnella thermotolerans TaxID=329858 RepID=UPI0006861C2C|nr:HD domain-containing phosphohydrolase [Cohnella thermotolerans]
MREVNVEDLSNGDVLAMPVKGKNGLVMLEAGTVLTEHYIRRLRGLGVRTVMLEEREASVPSRREGAREGTAHPGMPVDVERLKSNDAARKEACERAVKLAESDQTIGRVAVPMLEDRFRRQFRKVIVEIVTQRPLAEELGVLWQTDRLLFDHSLQVALFSCLVGLAKDYDEVKLYDLMVGAVLFDIGMTRLPSDLLKSKSRLTESERKLIKQHTVKGFEVLSHLPGVSAESAKCALLHHERYRGNGYPYGLKHPNIPEFAQIVGLADIYDALISPRHYRKPFEFGEAMEYLFAAGNYDFDLDLVQTFLRNVSMYPASLVVRLSNGQVGMVADVDHSLNFRPVVRIIREADGGKVQRPYEIDLKNYRDLVIVHAAMEEHEADS